MIKAQEIIDSLSAQDMINIEMSDLKDIEQRRLAEIKSGSR